MKISVIVSTYTEKRIKDIQGCLNSLRKQSLKPFEKILVLDPTPDLIRFYESKVPPDVKIVVSPKNGLSNARNTGIEHSKGEIIAFIDDDAFADRHWLENIAKGYEDPTVMGVGGSIKPHWDHSAPGWFPKEFYWTVGCSYQEHNRNTPIRNPIGCNMSFRRYVFEKVGDFRSDIGRYGKMLLAGEEAEFSLRLLSKIKDSKIICNPSAIVYHRVPQQRTSLRYLLRRAYYEGISKGIIANSNSSSKTLSTEQGYLKNLVFEFIPSRIRTIYTWRSASQLIFSILSVSAVFLGYIKARVSSL